MGAASDEQLAFVLVQGETQQGGFILQCREHMVQGHQGACKVQVPFAPDPSGASCNVYHGVDGHGKEEGTAGAALMFPFSTGYGEPGAE
jgi:hypothetical protein